MFYGCVHSPSLYIYIYIICIYLLCTDASAHGCPHAAFTPIHTRAPLTYTCRALGECILERALAPPPAAAAAAATELRAACRLFLDLAPRLETAAAAAAAAGGGGADAAGGGSGGGAAASLCECMLAAALVAQVAATLRPLVEKMLCPLLSLLSLSPLCNLSLSPLCSLSPRYLSLSLSFFVYMYVCMYVCISFSCQSFCSYLLVIQGFPE
jgi:hypothetical protein